MREHRLEKLISQSRTQVIWDVPSDHEMPIGERILWKLGVWGPILAVPFLFFAWSPFTPAVTVVHYASAIGCPVGEYFGMAPAAEGNPGYHKRLDGDRDGVACEPEAAKGLRGGGAGRFMSAPKAPGS